MKKSKNEKVPLFKWIWFSFLRTALIPLILVELVFISIYFITNMWSQHETVVYLKQEVADELNQLAIEKSDSLQQQLKSISYATQLASFQFKNALAGDSTLQKEDLDRLAYSEEGVYYTMKDKEPSGAAIFYSGIVPINETERTKVGKVLTVEPLLKDLVNSQPLATQIYLNTFDSLNIIYPYFDVISQYSPLMDIPSYNFYYEADLAHNPERLVKWTDAYLDPAGSGWMASAIAPVYNDQDFLEGVVGIDITVSTITEQILNMDIPWEGYALLVGKDGTILALPERGESDWGLSELTTHNYQEAILKDTFKPEAYNLYSRKDNSELFKEIASQSEGQGMIMFNGANNVVAWGTVLETGWKMLIIIPEANIYKKVDSMSHQLLMIGLFMVIGLVFFYTVFFMVLFSRSKIMTKKLSKPLLQINQVVKDIGKGYYTQIPPDSNIDELYETGNLIVEMGNQLGVANQNLLEAQMDLKALVNSIDDIIIEADNRGRIINVWDKNKAFLATEYLEKLLNAADINVDGGVQTSIEVIQRVIKDKQPESIEYQLETTNGLRWFQARISAIENSDHTVVISGRDITQRKIMEESLIKARDEAEKASIAKSQFLSNMSHELRTPLNAILGFSQIMQVDDSSPLTESQEENVGEIITAGQHLLNLINEVLDLSRIESGKMSLSIEPIHVRQVMEASVSLIKPVADKHGIELVYVCESCQDTYINADITRIKQVLLNLFSNGIKYNRPNGKMTISCEAVGTYVQFNVIDTGMGINKADMGAIFKPFHRLNTARDTIIEGTGIGLSVAKQLVELMHGEIGVESQVGVGSHFYVRIPKVEMAQNREQILKKSYTLKSDSFLILHVEDNQSNLDLVDKIVQAIPGGKVVSTTYGELCVDLAKVHRPDMILLDINLPGIDGYEVFKRLKEDKETASLPVVGLTASASYVDREKAIAMGFDEFLEKPLNVKAFMEIIERGF